MRIFSAFKTFGVFSAALFIMTYLTRLPESEDPERDTFTSLLRDLDCHKSSRALRWRVKAFFSEHEIIRRTSSCDTYFSEVPVHSLNMERSGHNALFPLAFGHTIHEQVGLLELYLALFFHSADSHCIHVDPKAPASVRLAVEQLTACYKAAFPQADLFIVEDPVPVFWARGSVLEADMRCLRRLLSSSNPWRLFLNAASSELPLVSLAQFRERLSQAKGESIVHFGKPEPGRQTNCYDEVRIGPNKRDVVIEHRPDCIKPPVPHNLTILKGYKNVALSREFSAFLYSHPVSKAFYDWLYDTRAPDEHFYSTMYTVRAKDGEVSQRIAEEMKGGQEYWLHGLCLRKTFWFDHRCGGEVIRELCNFGLRDLPRLRKSSCLMANKFNLKVDAQAALCQYQMIARAS